MHYKRKSALIKMIRRSKHRMEDVIFNLVQDVHRHPDKYTFDEKLRLMDRVNRMNWSALKELESILSSQDMLVAGVDALSSNAPEATAVIPRERTLLFRRTV